MKKQAKAQRYCKETRLYSSYGNCGSPIEGDGEMCAECAADAAAEAKRKAGSIEVFNDRELNTILHALRMMQDYRRHGQNPLCDDLHGCDHFEEVQPLEDEEIDALCERLNLAPEQPQENTLAGTALRNAEVFIGEELERRQQSGLPSDDPYLAEAHQALDLITAALGGQL